MTCLAAITDGTHVWMAAESQSTDGFGRKWIRHATQPKVIRRHIGEGHRPVLMASVGNVDLGGVLQDLSILGHPDAEDDADCNSWARAVASNWCESAMDLTPPPTTDGGGPDGAFLLAAAGRLWHCAGHDALRIDRYTAIGSGGDLALGALHALDATSRLYDPVAALRIAVETACAYDDSCGGAIHVDQIG